MQLAPGTILADKYRVERALGEGGMGVVVLATHVTLRQKIAVKLLRPEAMNNPALIERFEREARAAARVHGEHVARVIDVGKLPGGLPYIVMEYLEGEDLERALSRRGPLPVAEVVDYVLQTCEAVGEAHAANIVHRDLKPANLFLATRPNEDRPTLKVLDFGISKILEPETDAITKTSALMGTAYYMSPEQLTSSKKVDTRTDIWSLGVILYELLCGKRPFEAGTMPEVVAQILENSPSPIATYRTDVPPELGDVISQCLRRVPERFPTVSDLATALAPFAPAHALPLVARVHRLVPAARRSITASEAPSNTQVRTGRSSVAPPDLGATALGVTQPMEEAVETARSEGQAPPASRPSKATTARPGSSRGRVAAIAVAGAIGVTGLVTALLFATGTIRASTEPHSALVTSNSVLGPLPNASGSGGNAITLATPADTGSSSVSGHPTSTNLAPSASTASPNASSSAGQSMRTPATAPSQTPGASGGPSSAPKNPLQMGLQ